MDYSNLKDEFFSLAIKETLKGFFLIRDDMFTEENFSKRVLETIFILKIPSLYILIEEHKIPQCLLYKYYCSSSEDFINKVDELSKKESNINEDQDIKKKINLIKLKICNSVQKYLICNCEKEKNKMKNEMEVNFDLLRIKIEMFFQENLFFDFVDNILLRIPHIFKLKHILLDIFNHLELNKERLKSLIHLKENTTNDKNETEANNKIKIKKIKPILISKSKHLDKFSSDNSNEGPIIKDTNISEIAPSKINENYFKKIDQSKSTLNLACDKTKHNINKEHTMFIDSLRAKENLELDFLRINKKTFLNNFDKENSNSVLQEVNGECEENSRIANALFEPNSNSNLSNLLHTIKSSNQMINNLNQKVNFPSYEYTQFTFGNNNLSEYSQKENHIKGSQNIDIISQNEGSRISVEDRINYKISEKGISCTKSTGVSNFSNNLIRPKSIIFPYVNEDSFSSNIGLKGINSKLTDLTRIPKANKHNNIKKTKKTEKITSSLSTVLETYGLNKGKTTDELEENKKQTILKEDHPLKKIGRNFYANRLLKTPSPEIDSKKYSKRLLDKLEKNDEKIENKYSLLYSKSNNKKSNLKEEDSKNGIDFEKIKPELNECTDEEIFAYNTPTKEYCLFGKGNKIDNKRNVVELYTAFK